MYSRLNPNNEPSALKDSKRCKLTVKKKLANEKDRIREGLRVPIVFDLLVSAVNNFVLCTFYVNENGKTVIVTSFTV